MRRVSCGLRALHDALLATGWCAKIASTNPAGGDEDHFAYVAERLPRRLPAAGSTYSLFDAAVEAGVPLGKWQPQDRGDVDALLRIALAPDRECFREAVEAIAMNSTRLKSAEGAKVYDGDGSIAQIGAGLRLMNLESRALNDFLHFAFIDEDYDPMKPHLPVFGGGPTTSPLSKTGPQRVWSSSDFCVTCS